MKTIEIDGKSYLIDIEKAAEQGLLKEKDSKPHSWREYCYNTKRNIYKCYDFSSREESMAFMALGKLIQLRDAWWNEWKPDWHVGSKCKYTIEVAEGRISKIQVSSINAILTFPTEEMRDDFLETFRDLIEQAKMFL
mgnify:CR=1 FL=1